MMRFESRTASYTEFLLKEEHLMGKQKHVVSVRVAEETLQG